MMKVPEIYRIKDGPLGSDASEGNNGAFKVALSNRTTAYVIATTEPEWEHVSVHMESVEEHKIKGHSKSITIKRTPTWAEMCKIKDLFWDEEDTVVQFHPKKSDYVNVHEHCLHMWRPRKIKLNCPVFK